MKNAKNIFWLLIDAVLVVVILLGFYTFKALDKYGASLPITRTITISADGKTTVVPDIAKVTFSVVSEGADPEKLQVENTKKMVAALDFIKGEGIDPKDIKTAAYNLSPKYEYDEKKRKSFISGYTSTQSVTVKIRDFTKVSPILGRLPGLGVNQIQNVNFEVDDTDKFLNVAREEAFNKAFAKAAAMAGQNKVRLGRVVNFSESSGNYFPRAYAMESLGKGGADYAAPQLEPGSEELTVNVSVTYELR